MMKKDTRVIYAVALLRTIASAISGFAIEIFVRLSGASDIAMSLIAAVPSITYMLAALFLSGQADKLGRRLVILISSGVSFLATVLYIGLFVAVANLSVMIIMVILVEAIEGVFAGWFWPVLQARLGEDTNVNGSQIRIYNFSWNLGIILGNALVAGYASVSVDLRVLFPIVLQVLAWSTVINGIIFGLLWKKFEVGPGAIVIPGFAAGSPQGIPRVETPGKSPLTVPASIGVALVALFAFAFNAGGILTNLFNQVTSMSETTVVAVNLLPWIPIIDTTRQMTQLTTSGTYKVAKPAVNDLTRIVALMSVLALISGSASTSLARGGIIVLIFVLGIHGLLSGVLYNATMQIVLQDAPVHERGRFQGLYEAVLGMGFFVGPVVAGAMSEVKGFTASYNVLAGISFVATGVIASLQVRNVQETSFRVGGVATANARRFPVVIEVALAVAVLWVGLGVLGILGSLQILEGVALALAGTGLATVVLLQPRSDLMHVFDRLISPRPHVVPACTPNSAFAYCALTPAPLEVFPLEPS